MLSLLVLLESILLELLERLEEELLLDILNVEDELLDEEELLDVDKLVADDFEELLE